MTSSITHRSLILWPAVLLMTVALGFVLLRFINEEPRYKGKNLSQWCELLCLNKSNSKVTEEAQRAIREIGGEALPHLMRKLQAKDTHFKRLAEDLVDKCSLGAWLRIKPVGLHQAEAIEGIAALGPIAKPAIPALTKLLEHDSTACRAIVCLTANDGGNLMLIPEAIPALLQAATNRNMDVRARAVNALGLAQTNATETIPALLRALNDPELQVRANAARGLGGPGYREQAAVIIPALIGHINDPEPYMRTACVWRLGQFRHLAKEAVPALLRLGDDPDSDVRSEAANALKRINP